MSPFDCDFRYRSIRHGGEPVSMPGWHRAVPRRATRTKLRGHIAGQLVYMDAFRRRRKVRAAMSLQDGTVYVHPSGQRSQARVHALGWCNNPSGDGELQVWGFGCIPIRDGSMYRGTELELNAIAQGVKRLPRTAYQSVEHRGH